jgi:hypothetical protein
MLNNRNDSNSGFPCFITSLVLQIEVTPTTYIGIELKPFSLLPALYQQKGLFSFHRITNKIAKRLSYLRCVMKDDAI